MEMIVVRKFFTHGELICFVFILKKRKKKAKQKDDIGQRYL